MNTHADKTQENKSQSVSASGHQMQSGGESTFQFVDNRPEAVPQRKLQEMANDSPQISQLRVFQEMASNSPQAKQVAQLQVMADNHSAQQQQPIQKKENNTGLPDNLKTGMENLSGMSLDDVKVHRNSDKPAQLQAHAYAQGTDIHLGPGQEKYLPHEAWHVVQQKQGRVKPTMQMMGKVNVNDDKGLEKEADFMGAKAVSSHNMIPGSSTNTLLDFPSVNNIQLVQRVLTLDNGDFSEVNKIEKIGGNAEGAFLISDGSGDVVLKISEDIDSAVMAYNLAKDFGINTPKGRYMSLKTLSGITLIEKAQHLLPGLAVKLEAASSVTLWSLVDGAPLKGHQNKGPEDASTKRFMDNPTNFEELGRMLVFDAAILNVDRFKIESGAEANAGNVMIEHDKPVAIDQDFASIDKLEDSTPSEQIETYGQYVSSKMQPFFSDSKALAVRFCQKMEHEGYPMFKTQEVHVKAGINQGIVILKNLLHDANPRLEKLIAWSKTFKPDTDLNLAAIKAYWKTLLPSEKD